MIEMCSASMNKGGSLGVYWFLYNNNNNNNSNNNNNNFNNQK